MVRGRAPGCNSGLPMEFYFKVSHVLGNVLVLVLNYAFLSGSSSRFQRWGNRLRTGTGLASKGIISSLLHKTVSRRNSFTVAYT